jgi:hypothetical protein
VDPARRGKELRAGDAARDFIKLITGRNHRAEGHAAGLLTEGERQSPTSSTRIKSRREPRQMAAMLEISGTENEIFLAIRRQ